MTDQTRYRGRNHVEGGKREFELKGCKYQTKFRLNSIILELPNPFGTPLNKKTGQFDQ